MTAEDGAAAFAAWWVRCYTARVGAEAAEDRRAEIDSDLWEQRAHARSVGAPPHAVALSIVRRVTGGVPADLVWSRQQRGVSRERAPEREVTVSRWARPARHSWWTAAAAAVALFYVWVAAGNLADPQDPSAEGSVLAALCAATVLVGLGLRGRHRVVGDVLLAVSVAPAVVVIWFWPVAVTALVVLVCAVVDLAEARSLRRPGPLGVLVRAALVVAVLGTALAWTAMLSVGGWVTVLVACVALVALLVLVAVPTRRDPVAVAPRAATEG
ncbi:hypothetical protein [Pseudonocardia broussonetiae]|uniref:Uncharacterized protein n=1 Tax=Pseudonocardia broussonetiae TaxID=2736640 RepID=A0A6M6JCX4_9PSEU|nr:hypothetical protein [Pseudonocardia broussonetiae]QJY44930.1 hypothetical protein HOP40_03015 [Pseudonocardia broussonetiae]